MLYIHEATNLFVGDDGPNNSKHLMLDSVKLPTLEEITTDHHAGGAIGAIKIGGLGLQALEVSFKLKGHDPQTLSQFGLGSRNRLPFTCYGAVRDKKVGRMVEMKAIMQGRLVRIEGDDLRRAELVGHDHMISEIWHYQLWWDNAEKYFYDFLTSEWRVDGVSQFAETRNILRIPGAAS